MKHLLTIDSNVNQFTVTTEGDGNADGIIAFVKEIISHSQWKPGKNILQDHRELRIDGIKMNGIESLAHFFKQVRSELGSGKVALVMKRDIDFGIARTWEILTAGEVDIAIEVFRSIDEAQRWLVK